MALKLTLPKILPNIVDTKVIFKELKERAPDIAIGFGIVGLITAGVMAVAVTPKADRKLSRAEVKKGRKLTKMEAIKEVGVDYIPSIALSAMSAASIILGTKELHKRTAAIMALCTLAETSLTDYKSQVVELLGKEKAEEIAIAADNKRAEAMDNTDKYIDITPQVIDPTRGLQPFWDLYVNRPFYGSENEIEKVVNVLNRRINEHRPVSLNDFYYELGQDGVSFGENVGWSEYTDPLEIRYGAYRDKAGIARTTINFKYEPNEKFN